MVAGTTIYIYIHFVAIVGQNRFSLRPAEHPSPAVFAF
jgi:hypothetical protein